MRVAGSAIGARRPSALIRATSSEKAKDLGFARLDVRPQQAGGFLRTASDDCAQNLRVLVVRLVDAMRLREIEPPDDADAFRDFAMAPGDLGIARGGDQRHMERFVERRDLQAVMDALALRKEPDRFQRLQAFALLHVAEPRDRGELEDQSQVVEVLELTKIERPHAPSHAQVHGEVAFALEPVKRLAHGRAAHGELLCDLRLGEAIAGQQREVVRSSP